MNNNLNKYNCLIHFRKSIRKKGYNYSSTGLDFKTCCAAGQIPFLGAIKNGIMELSKMGKILNNEWLKSGEYLIMPNDVHAIMRITRKSESHSPLNEQDVATVGFKFWVK